MEASIRHQPLPSYVNYHFYTVRLNNKSIKTFVTFNPLTVIQWIHNTESFRLNRNRHRLVVGLDIQYRPTFACRRIAATINLCAGGRCIVYQFLHSRGIPEWLVLFFNSPRYIFVGIGIKNDLDRIEKDFKYGIVTPTVVDLRDLAARRIGDREIRNAGMEELAKRVLDLVIVRPREIAFSRWDNRVLTHQQVQFACIQAFISKEIGCILRAS